jgi:hypothetical protein
MLVGVSHRASHPVNGSGAKSQKVFNFLELRDLGGILVPPALAFSGKIV